MPLMDPATWSEHLRHTLEQYDEPLLRLVANKLCKPRNQWPTEELIERCLATFSNPAVIDRRLADLDPACTQILALIGHSRQPRWRVGNLVEMAVALGHEDGLQPVVTLLEAGLLYPHDGAAGPKVRKIRSFDLWLGQTTSVAPTVFGPPEITARAMGLNVAFPACPGAVVLNKPAIHEADGLDLPLRLAALWQMVHAVPLRRTQTSGFFKRDLERLQGDPKLNDAPPDSLAEIPDPALLAVVLATQEGLLKDVAGELQAGVFPTPWDKGLQATLASLWTAALQQDAWNAQDGWRPEPPAANPYPSMWLLALMLLSRLPADGWTSCDSLEKWLTKHHPFWQGPKAACGLAAFLLGVVYPLRLIQTAREGKGPWLVRLSPLGRWLLGLGPVPTFPTFPQTLLVQPNLEILVYRQGLSPALIAHLTKLANWQTLGAACTLQLEPQSVYRALETGESFESIQQTLQRHGMKPTPDTVINALRTWSNKRERIRVYTAGALFEFNSPEDLADALARGLPAVRLSEKLAVVANDQNIDYRHFRLSATRDYALPPERCVEVDDDGVTLAIDLAKSDLLIETEVRRFAEPLDRSSTNGRRYYRMTPTTLASTRDSGLSLQTLDTWFFQRSGQA
ncbi:MAG TPA: helicase-associated domain-containing protein, partial [Gemmataceae bacterium]|nr:helicase-associated domain-containing protein [Gemmataceae bacterium]